MAIAMRLAILVLGLSPLFSMAARAENPASLAQAIIDADAAGTETPRVSVLDSEIDLDGAYRVQQQVVDHMLEGGDRVAGYKTGLTGKLARWWFKIDDPVFGVIMESGLRRSGDTVVVPGGRHMLLETELAFVAGQRIDSPVADVSALKPMIRGIAPVVEAPAGGFPRDQARKLTVEDIVANNVSAHFLIVGEEQPYEGLDLAKVAAVMKRGDETVSEGAGADVMGDPWKSALWLVNVAVREGRVIEPGHYLSSGVIGERVESEAGRYNADFGTLGVIEFTVE